MNKTKDTLEITCDKYDYMGATICGAIAGIIDIIFVGRPDIVLKDGTVQNNSILGKVVDQSAEGFTQRAAQFFWSNDKRNTGKPKKMPQTLEQCVSYLEQAFPVSYDARYAKDLAVQEGVLRGMNPKNHHLLSLAHSPDIVGLIFSIIDQFNGDATFVDQGKIIRVQPLHTSKAIPYMQGSDIQSKIFCGFVNWIGHNLSDMVGSSSTKNKGNRGMGIPMPFFEMFLFDNKMIDKDGKTIADLMIKVYEEGYDLRFGLTMSIPVVLEELFIRTLWSLRQRISRKKLWKECIPSDKHANLRMMLLVGNSALCVIDGADAVIRGALNRSMVHFVCHFNMVAWTRLATVLVQEAFIRAGTELDIKMIFGEISEKDRVKIEALSKTVKEYMSALDVWSYTMKTLKEYQYSLEERHRVELECNEKLETLKKYQIEMEDAVEKCLLEHMSKIECGFGMMHQGILDNDVEQYIAGNVVIQETMDYDVQFKNQKEFDDIMLSENALKL